MAEPVFGNAFARGIDQTQAMGFAFAKTLGDLTGFDALSEWGEDGALRNLREAADNPPVVESWDDVDSLSAFGDYVIEALGESLPSMLIPLPGAVGGGLIAKKIAEKTILSKIEKAAVGKALKNKLPPSAFDEFTKRKAARVGQAIGAGIGTTAINTGETQLQFDERGIDNPGGVFAAGIAKGALDVVGLGRIADAARVTGVRPGDLLELSANVLKEAGVTGTIEGVTEGLQTVIDLVAVKANDPTFDIFDAENLKEIREAVLKGAIAGGTVGGTVNTLAQMHDYRQHRNARLKELEDLKSSVEFTSAPFPGSRDRPEYTPEQLDEFQRENDLPIPESQAVVDAQLAAVQDPTSTKEAMLVTAGSPNPAITNNDTAVFQSPDYTDADGSRKFVLTRDRKLAGALDQLENPTVGQIGELLFNRPEGKLDTEGGFVLVSRNADGVPVSEMATSEATFDRDLETAEGITPEGGHTEVVNEQISLGERIARLAAEHRGDTEPTDIPQISAFFAQLPLAHQRAVVGAMRESPRSAGRVADTVAQLARGTPEQQTQFISGLQAQFDAEVQEDLARFGPEQPVEIADEAAIDPQLTVGREPARPIESFPDELNRGAAGFASLNAAERQLAKAEADPNVLSREIVAEERFGRTIYRIKEARLPSELAPEQSGSSSVLAVVNQPDSTGRSRPTASARRDTTPRSETSLVTQGLNKARLTGMKRERLVNTAASADLESKNPGARRRAARSYAPVIAPDGTTQNMTAADLSDAGMDLLRARGVAREMTLPEFKLLGLTTMLAELKLRGYDTRFFMDKRDPNKLDPNVLLSHGSLQNPADNGKDLSVGDAQAVAAQPNATTEKASDGFLPESTVLEQDSDQRRREAETAEERAIVVEQSRLERAERKLAEAKESGRKGAIVVAERQVQKHKDEIKGLEAQVARIEERTAQVEKQRQDRQTKGVVEQDTTEEKGSGERPSDAPPQTAAKRAERERQDAIEKSLKRNGDVKGHGASVSQTDVDFVAGLFAELGIELPVTILDVDSLGTEVGAALSGGRAKEVAQRFKDNPTLKGTTYRTPAGPVIVVRGFSKDKPTSTDKAIRTLVLGHEAGHQVLAALAKNLPKVARARLEKLFEADKARTPTQAWQGDNGFAEWFSDKVAARARNLSAKPSSLADRVFRDAAKQLRTLWNAVKGRIPKRFHVNTGFDQVIDQMKQADIFDTSEILNVITTEFEDIHFSPSQVRNHVNQATLRDARRGLRKLMNGAADAPIVGKVFFTTDGRLRGIPGAEKIADALYGRSNTRQAVEPWQQGVSASRRQWIGALETAMTPYWGDQAAIDAAFYELSNEVPTTSLKSPLAKEIRKLLEEYYDQYLSKRIPDLERVEFYFPRAYNTMQMLARSAEFAAILAKHKVDNAAEILDAIAKEPGEYSTASLKATTEGWQKERVFVDKPELIKDLIDAGFLNTSPYEGLRAYIYKSTSRAEYERIFGRRHADGSWDSQGKLRDMLQGVAMDRRGEVLALVDATVHPAHADPSNLWHNILGEVKAFESLRTLVFSGAASIPETAGIFTRTKGGLSLKQFSEAVRESITNRQQAKEFAVALGVVRHAVGAAAATEMLQDPVIGPNARGAVFRKALPHLFRFNFNDAIVNFSRTASVMVARTFLLQQAHNIENGVDAAQAKRFLGELGIKDHKAVLRWEANGASAWSLSLTGQAAQDAAAAGRAISRFVDESVIHPNSSERPTWANHPVAGLAFHLKTFAYSFNKNIISGIFREMENRLDAGGVQDLARYTPFLLASAGIFLALGAASDELRQRILSMGERGTFRANRYDPVRTAKKWVDRAGFTSLPYFDALVDPNPESLAYAAGPTAHHIYETLFEDYGPDSGSIKALKSVPGLSQFPQVRKEILALDD